MVAIPDGVSVEVHGATVKAKGPKGEVEKTFSSAARISAAGKELKVECPDRAYRGTVEALLSSMVKGAKDGFRKELKVIHAHFPVSIEVKGKDISIKNFLGEKQPRKTVVVGPTKVEVKGASVVVSGPDREGVGQTAANLRNACRIRDKDARVFQDGIYPVG